MLVICGETANDPVEVARVCRENPLDEVYALPWVTTYEELAENRKVNRGLPNRVVPCEPNCREEPDCESIEFYDRLEDDAFGNMADALKHQRSVINQTMDVPCPHGFYGRVLTHMWHPGSVVIVRCVRVQEMFPVEPLSAKLYAMTTVPVMMRNTDKFRDMTGIQEDEVAVLAATDFIPRIVPFMDFHRMFVGGDFVFSVEPSTFIGPPPLLWRYNRAYRLNYAASLLRQVRNPG